MSLEKVYYISGLPRSCSTLLVNLMRQNPRVHASSSSPIIEMIGTFRNNWTNHPFTRAMDRNKIDDIGANVMRGMMKSYAESLSNRPVFLDKQRGWTAFPEMAALCANVSLDKLRIICCVRNLFEVAASMERRHRASSDTRNTMVKMLPNGQQNLLRVEDRLQDMFNPDNGVIGNPILCMKEMYARGYGKQMFILEAEKFAEKPAKWMRDIYDFLEETPFEHNFKQIEQTEKEDDFVFGFKELHDLRAPHVNPDCVKQRYDQTFIGDVVESPLWKSIKEQQEFWKSWKVGNP